MLKKWFCRFKTPSRRMLDIVAREFEMDGKKPPRHEVWTWSNESHGTSATPPGYYIRGWMGFRYVQYFCDECDNPLSAGPSGGGTNSVCTRCSINFGTLPLSLER